MNTTLRGNHRCLRENCRTIADNLRPLSHITKSLQFLPLYRLFPQDGQEYYQRRQKEQGCGNYQAVPIQAAAHLNRFQTDEKSLRLCLQSHNCSFGIVPNLLVTSPLELASGYMYNVQAMRLQVPNQCHWQLIIDEIDHADCSTI